MFCEEWGRGRGSGRAVVRVTVRRKREKGRRGRGVRCIVNEWMVVGDSWLWVDESVVCGMGEVESFLWDQDE